MESSRAIDHWMMLLPASVEVCRMRSVFCRKKPALVETSFSGGPMIPSRLMVTPNSSNSGSLEALFAANALRLSTKAVTPSISWGTRTMIRVNKKEKSVRKARPFEAMRRLRVVPTPLKSLLR